MIDGFLGQLENLLLVLLGLGALGGAAAMIVMRQPMRVALALITAMVCLGGIYGLLGVHVIAVFQVMIYVGAVMVFMVYVIMLLEVREEQRRRYSRLLIPGAVGFVLLLGALGVALLQATPSVGVPADGHTFGIAAFAVSFLNDYWLHFELTSVLLVAVVVAALAVIKISRRVRHG